MSPLFSPPSGAGDIWNWDSKITNANQRFKVLSDFNGDAVLDKETGLVWEKAPDTTARAWSAGRSYCIDKNVGGRKGWRLPSIPELASVIDPSVAFPAAKLPAGHPFTNVQAGDFWSAATDAETPIGAWYVRTGDGGVRFDLKNATYQAWCVRGGMNADAY